MIGVLGVLLLCLTLLLDRWTYNHSRRPRRSDWARREALTQACVAAIVLGFFAGVSLVAFAVEHRAELAFGWPHATVVLALLAGTGFAHAALRRQWRTFAAEAPAPPASAEGARAA